MKHKKTFFMLVACMFLAANAVASSFNLEREIARVMMDPRIPDTSQPKWQRSSYQDIIDAARAARLDSRQTSIDVPGNITGKNPMSIRYVSGLLPEEPALETWGDDEDIVYVTGETVVDLDQVLTILPGTLVLFSAFNDDVTGGQLSPALIQDLRDAYAVDPGAGGLLQTMIYQAPYINHFADLWCDGVLIAKGEEDNPILFASDASASELTPFDWRGLHFSNGIVDYAIVVDCQIAGTGSLNNTLASRSRFDNNLETCKHGSGYVVACHLGNVWNECVASPPDNLTLDIQYNLFDNSWNWDIVLFNALDSVIIRHNTFHSGILVLDTYASPLVFEFEANDFTSYGVTLETTEDVDAQFNYWGTTSVPVIGSRIHDENDDPQLGRVNYVPFLTSPDTDRDGLRDDEEGVLGTDPDVMDSDNDGLIDGLEVEHGANPLVADTDGDGQNDGTEVWLNGTDPTDPESRLPVSSAIGFAALAGLLVTLTSYRIIRSRLTCRNVKNR